MVGDREMKKAQINVLLVEDNPTDVLVVKSYIEESPDFRLDTVERLSKAIERLKVKDCDIVLLDLNLPDAIGLEGLVKLRAHVGGVAVIVFTGLDDEQIGVMALQRGAQDYLVKGVDTGRLVRSMRYAIERMRAHSLPNYAENSEDVFSGTAPRPAPHEVLTERELQVLKLLGKGYTNQEIYRTLSISLATAKTHISAIFRKLLVKDRTNAILEARKSGLI